MIFSLFKRKELPPEELPPKEVDHPAPRPKCRFCGAVKTAGRSGEKTIKFVDGTTATIEIINQSKVEGRLCYSLFVMNEPEIGWTEVPIKCCPLCGKHLNKGREC